MNKLTSTSIFIIALLLVFYCIWLLAAAGTATYNFGQVPFFKVVLTASRIGSPLLVLYYIVVEAFFKPEQLRRSVFAILLVSLLLLTYTFCLIWQFPYMTRIAGWSYRELIAEKNPLILSGTVFATVLLLLTAQLHFKIPALQWIAVLTYLSCLLFLIATELVARSAIVPNLQG